MPDRDRFRYQRHRFQPAGGGGYPGLTPMVQRLLILNAVVYIAQQLLDQNFFESSGITFTALFSLNPILVFQQGYIWQPFTYMWLHGGLWHIVFNMFALWMFGSQLETAWGSKRFLRFYLQCGLGAGVIILGWEALTSPGSLTLGASGAIYGVLLGFSLTWPDRTIMLLFPPIPFKAIWFIPVLFGMQLLMSGGGARISHAGHLGGVIIAAIIMRDEAKRYIGMSSLRHRWHRFRVRHRLRSVRRDEWEKRKKEQDDSSRFH